MKVRLRVIGPFLVYFLVFVFWFPAWQQGSHSLSTRLLGLLFGAMTAVLGLVCIVGVFVSPLGLGRFVELAIEVYETFFKKEFAGNGAENAIAVRKTGLMSFERPPVVIMKRLRSGTPVRGSCPLCGVEFSTEAFDEDKTYPHELTLAREYEDHFEYHVAGDES